MSKELHQDVKETKGRIKSKVHEKLNVLIDKISKNLRLCLMLLT